MCMFIVYHTQHSVEATKFNVHVHTCNYILGSVVDTDKCLTMNILLTQPDVMQQN